MPLTHPSPAQWLSGAPAAGDSWAQPDWRSAFEGLVRRERECQQERSAGAHPSQFLALDPATGAGHQDDMLFFVRPQAAAAAAESKARARARRPAAAWR